MSHYMTAIAMQQKGLKPATKIVLYWLADHHNGETNRCFPSLKRLSECCEMSKRSVQMQIDHLKEIGLLRIEHSYRPDGQQTSNNFVLELTGNPENASEAGGWQNLLGGVAKSARGGWQNLPANNLVSNNLVSKQDIFIKFDEFFSVYPRKVGKGAAKKAWEKAIEKTDADYIISSADAYAASVEGKDVKFIPHPTTWLNQERYDDKIEMEAENSKDQGLLMKKLFKEMGMKYDA